MIFFWYIVTKNLRGVIQLCILIEFKSRQNSCNLNDEYKFYFKVNCCGVIMNMNKMIKIKF